MITIPKKILKEKLKKSIKLDHDRDLMEIENIIVQDLDLIEIIIIESKEITKINTERELMAVTEMIIKKKVIATEMREVGREDNAIIKNQLHS